MAMSLVVAESNNKRCINETVLVIDVPHRLTSDIGFECLSQGRIEDLKIVL